MTSIALRECELSSAFDFSLAFCASGGCSDFFPPPAVSSWIEDQSGDDNKWLARGGKLLIVDEPTRGVDGGATAALHALIDELAQRGLAVLLISSELPKVIYLSTCILVMREDELSRAQASQEAVLRLMAGVTEKAA